MPHDCFCSDNDWTNSENRTRGVSIKRWRSSSSAFFDIHWRTNNRSARAAFIGFGKCVPNKQTVNFSKMALLATTSSTMEKKISKQGFRMSKFRTPVDAVIFSLGMWWISCVRCLVWWQRLRAAEITNGFGFSDCQHLQVPHRTHQQHTQRGWSSSMGLQRHPAHDWRWCPQPGWIAASLRKG